MGSVFVGFDVISNSFAWGVNGVIWADGYPTQEAAIEAAKAELQADTDGAE